MRRAVLSALVLAWPAAADEPPPAPPDAELLEFLGETEGVDEDLVLFMRTPEAERELKRAQEEAAKEEDDE
jgi:hypothetical protein